MGLLGAGYGWLALVLYPLFVLPLPGWVVILVGVSGGGLVALIALGMVSGNLPISATKIEAANLVAQRGEPRCWLVAHADSKGQRLSLRGRVIAVLVFGLGIAAIVGALAVRLLGPLPWLVSLTLTALVLVGGGAMSLSAARNDSAGAVDNATGLIAALAAAETLKDRTDIGVLITDAEELGMEGARAWVRAGCRGELFVNFDGIDSRGQFRIKRHGRRQAHDDLATGIADQLSGIGAGAKIGRLPPGVLVDGIVLGAAGMSGVTVSRGDWSTLGIVHTERDDADRVDLSATVEAGHAAASAVRSVLIDDTVRAP